MTTGCSDHCERRRPNRTLWRLVVAAALAALSGCTDRGSEPARFVRRVPWIGRGEWLKADTDVHTVFSDGTCDVGDVVAAAAAHGCDVIALTDFGDRKLGAAMPRFADAIEFARREHPSMLVLSGLNWIIPPGQQGDTANVLIPPGPDEFRLLSRFRQSFDGRGNARHGAAAFESALQWLEATAGHDDVRPVVIYNLPGGRTRDSVKVVERISRWRAACDVLIGISGAPRRRVDALLGGERYDNSPIDRWDPAAARVGDVWDRLLRQGTDVWAACAASGFRERNAASGGARDYWPGEFSETWLYVPSRSAEGVLLAFRAGSFFGAHGHIAREVELTVDAAGLPRPAHAGEAIEVGPGSAVVATLDCKIPALDWAGESNRIDAIELIAAGAEGARVIARRPPQPTGPVFSHVAEIPAGGLVVRARGRRIVEGGADLMFYTNPVRIARREQQAWLRIGGFRLRPLGPRQWVGLSIILFGVAALAVTHWRRNRAMLIDNRDSRQGGERSIAMWPVLTVLGLYCAFVVYGSLVPLEFAPLGFGQAVDRFLEMCLERPARISRLDYILNVMLYVPIAFGLMFVWLCGSRSRRRLAGAIFGVLALCFALSIAIESAQLWVPARTPSPIDVAAQAMGATLGIALWLVVGSNVESWLCTFRHEEDADSRLGRLLTIYLVGWTVYLFLPLDFSLNLGDLYGKFRAGRVTFVPFAGYSLGFESARDLLFEVVVVFPVGVWLMWRLRRRRPGTSIFECTVMGILLLAGLHLCQLPVMHRETDFTKVVSGAAGVALGAWVMQGYAAAEKTPLSRKRDSLFPTAIWLTLAAVYALFLCAYYWSPFEILEDGRLVRSRLEGFFRLPFRSYYEASDLSAVTGIVRKILLFGIFGAIHAKVVASISASTARRRFIAGLLVAFAAATAIGIELGQAAFQSHVPDAADAVVAFGGAMMGMWLAAQVTRRSEAADARLKENER